MKKMMLVIVVLALVCGVSSSALSESRVAVIRNGETFKVIYKNTDLADVKVTISNSNGEKVFSEELISVHGFIRPYNFAELPKGDYMICITDVDGKKTEKICFDEQAVKNKKEWTAHIGKLTDDQKKVIVAVPQQKVNNFSVHVYDKYDQLVYTEDPALEKEYARVFDLKRLEGGATVHLVNHATGETKYYKAE
ncbi:MAG TPA: hypothetical protein VL728_08420 [Cyclobacteriaceae bacterium]|jgi:hypothetical protein|nr:hypothetical protein [Cyclobacteriaceae bacterium]